MTDRGRWGSWLLLFLLCHLQHVGSSSLLHLQPATSPSRQVEVRARERRKRPTAARRVLTYPGRTPRWPESCHIVTHHCKESWEFSILNGFLLVKIKEVIDARETTNSLPQDCR